LNTRLKPAWWCPTHAHFRVDFEKIGKVKRVLLVNDINDTIVVTFHRKSTNEWAVEYTKLIPGRNDSVHRTIHMSRRELESAFDLTETPKNEPAWSARFDLEVGVEGCFARTGNFLNVPNPNVSLEKDSSISIQLTARIKQAIGHLLTETA
jgi:hypothetical protein